MKILQINKFYHDKDRAGGVGRYFLSLINTLEENGHEVQVFAMQDKNALSSIYSSYFVKEQDFSSFKFTLGTIKKAFKFIYSFEARKKIEKFLKQHKPDIVHIHNIYHHITPSILPVIKKYNIPIVQTLHDFHLISPNYNLCHHGKIHESCARHPMTAMLHKCIRHSFWASSLVVLKIYFERLSKIYLKNIDFFIAPSEFTKKKHIQYGLPQNKILLLKPFIKIADYVPAFSPGKYVLFFGRLHEQKGLKLLVNTFADLPQIPLKIAGTGEQRRALETLILAKKTKNIELLGPVYGKHLKELIAKSAFVIVPSLSYENAPFVVLESFALGKPVIASNIGGLPELVREQKTGLLFEAGNKEDLKKKILTIFPYPCLIRSMGLEARLLIEKEFSQKKHYQDLIKIYHKAINKQSLAKRI